MTSSRVNGACNSPVLSAHLLNVVEFEACLALEQRLVYEAAGRTDGHITLLLCEHPTCITVGRQGSRADIRLEPAEAGRREVNVRWVNRGGPAMMHAPGQLAIYPIVPLEYYGWTVGDYLERLESGLLAVLTEGGYIVHREPARRGIWGRSGQLAAIGVAVKSMVTYFGAYLNVSPAMQSMRWVDSDLLRHAPLSSLAAERSQVVRMASVRERVIRNLVAAFGSPRLHIHAGHPLLVRRAPSPTPTRAARVG